MKNLLILRPKEIKVAQIPLEEQTNNKIHLKTYRH